MKRLPFILKFRPGRKETGLDVLKSIWGDVKAVLDRNGVSNYSVWNIQDFLFFYGESETAGAYSLQSALYPVAQNLLNYADLFAWTDDLRLMYHDIGIVREDKSLIRHRVFATKLKPGCAEEYKARHDALIAARGDEVKDGPESNFTIWHAHGYIFGYCELVKAFDHEMTEEEKASTIVWETRQLEIMDWLTDDVDWITGEKHDKVQLVCC